MREAALTVDEPRRLAVDAKMLGGISADGGAPARATGGSFAATRDPARRRTADTTRWSPSSTHAGAALAARPGGLSVGLLVASGAAGRGDPVGRIIGAAAAG